MTTSSSRFRAIRATILSLALAAAFIVPTSPASAASETYTVTKTADTADGTCDADCSLREAISAANANDGADMIILPAGTYPLTIATDASVDDNGEGDLDVTDDVTIVGDGSGTTTIDAEGDGDGEDDGDHRVIEVVGTGIALGISGVTITGGDVDSTATNGDGSGGGAIALDTSDVLSLDDVVLTANYADGDGGAIDAQDDANEGNIIRIENSTLSDNEATDGGAITLAYSTLTIRNSTFSGNVASSDAGAIDGYESVTVRVWDTTFSMNSAGGSYGGAVYIGNSDYGNIFQCTNCTFDQNTAPDGGAIVVDYDTVAEISGSTFTGNDASSEGGAIYAYTDETHVSVTESEFSSNTADYGGAIYADTATFLLLDDVLLEGNTAETEGGGLASYEAEVTIRNSTFRNNTAFDSVTPSNDTNGGAIAVDDYGEYVIEDSLFEGNSATYSGGAFHLYDTGLIVRDSVFRGNFVDDRGEGDDAFGGALSTEDCCSSILAERTLFEDNYAIADQDAFGGVIYAYDGPLTILDSEFRNNRAETRDTTDTYRSAGGAVHAFDHSSPTEVRRSLFVGNSAVGDDAVGGAFFLDDENVTSLTNTTLSGNSADVHGGAVYVEDGATLRSQYSTFVGNSTVDDTSGGAVYIEPATSSDAMLKGTLLQANTAGGSAENCDGDPVTSNGHNIADDATCSLDEPSDQADTTVAYDALADNGGPTETHALPAGSGAIDAGAESCTDVAGVFEITTDQRGAGRPVDGDEDGTTACDVGAFEYQEAVTVVASDASASEDPVLGDDGTGTFTFSRPGTNGDLTVHYSISGTATADDDYQALSGSVVIPDGSASATVTVTPIPDDDHTEGDETVVAEVSPDVSYAVGTPSSATVTIEEPAAPTGADRLFGTGRIGTAIDISNDSYGDDEAGAVVLARADTFPDALAGTPLAAATNAPILLTNSDQLLSEVEAEIARVLPSGGKVYLLGGTNALAQSIQDDLDDSGYDTERLGGTGRIETSILIAEELGNPDTLLLTTGFNFPDALAAGAAAANVNGAVVLTPPDERHPSTDAYLASNDDAELWAIGGPSARAYLEATGIVGTGRVETAALTAREFFDGPATVGLATAGNFPDALAGGAHIARYGGPLLITPTDLLHEAAEDYLCDASGSLNGMFAYGGTSAISASVFDDASDRIDGTGC